MPSIRRKEHQFQGQGDVCSRDGCGESREHHRKVRTRVDPRKNRKRKQTDKRKGRIDKRTGRIYIRKEHAFQGEGDICERPGCGQLRKYHRKREYDMVAFIRKSMAAAKAINPNKYQAQVDELITRFRDTVGVRRKALILIAKNMMPGASEMEVMRVIGEVSFELRAIGVKVA